MWTPLGWWMLLSGLSASDCPEWSSSFGFLGTDSVVHALETYDDGVNGPAVCLGGEFRLAGDVNTNSVVLWDGSEWRPLAEGITGGLKTLHAIPSPGGGDTLYCGGGFTQAGEVPFKNIAQWNGSEWSALGSGTDGRVDALGSFDDGTGLHLYAGGFFTRAGGVTVNGIAKWTGAQWVALDGGVSGYVSALCAHDDGRGPSLFAAGGFWAAGPGAARSVARWDGSAWSDVGGGVDGRIWAMTVFDDGQGPALFVAGYFSEAGGVPANNIAKWDGSTWSALGSGLSSSVFALSVFGSPPELYAGGGFLTAGGQEALKVARWDGTRWASAGRGVLGADVKALGTGVLRSGGGEHLFAGGDMFFAGRKPAQNVAAWSGTSWSPIGSEAGVLRDPHDKLAGVYALERGHDLNSGDPVVYAGGRYRFAGRELANGIAMWDGSGWHTLGTGLQEVTGIDVVNAIEASDCADPAIFVGGLFYSVGNQLASNIASWDGRAWSPLGEGTDASVLALLERCEDGVRSLYVGGAFSRAGGIPASRIAKWTSSGWEAVGGGTNGLVLTIVEYDDGKGEAVYVGGQFTSAGGIPVNHVARWDGQAWSPLGAGTNSPVNDLRVLDDGTGPALYAGGRFTSAGGVVASRVARWNGVSWESVGDDLFGYVLDLAAFDDGRGEGQTLYAGGVFNLAGVSWNVARLSQGRWLPVGSGLRSLETTASATAFAVHQGGEPGLLVGGRFELAGDSASSMLAMLRPCPADGSFCTDPGNPCPCDNPGRPGAGCDNAQATGGVSLAYRDFHSTDVGLGRVTLVGSGFPPNGAPAVLAIHAASRSSSPVPFGGGLMCLDPQIAIRGPGAVATNGHVALPFDHTHGPGTFFYQLLYRNLPISHCNPGFGANVSGGLTLTWP